MQVNGEERQANFRSESPQHTGGVSGQQPQTGLSVLMNNNNNLSGTNPPPLALPSAAAYLNPDQMRRQQEDLADRDRQASALAAAGMVAESVRVVSQPTTVGLHPPPQLATGGSAAASASGHPTNEIDSINWNMMDVSGAHHLDDMDLDFAQLFDPVNELANMHAEGGDWQTTADAGVPQHQTSPPNNMNPTPSDGRR